MYKKANLAAGTLSAQLLVGGSSLVLQTDEGLKFPDTGSGNTFVGVIWGAAYSSPEKDATTEFVTAYRSSGDTFTIVRAQEGTAAKQWEIGDNFMLTASKAVFDEYETALGDKADKTNVLELDNTDAFTPDADYEPATKKYVDDNIPDVPVKATAAEINAGTNDEKFATALSLAGIRFVFKGAWATSKKYIVNDCVQQGGSGYVCMTAHTSGTFATDLAAGKWSLFVQGVGDEAWTSFTPTVTAATGTFTSVSATGLYKQIGKTVFYEIVITVTTKGTADQSVRVTPPVNIKNNQGMGSGVETANTGKALVVRYISSTSILVNFYDNTFCGADNSVMRISGFYEVS